jgi:hypothetical protein
MSLAGMSSLKAFEDSVDWHPVLPRVRTSERDSGNDSDSAWHQDSSEFPRVDSPQYRTDNFMMYGFKVAMCSRQGRHKWDNCPFAHPTENARRRDPRLYSYSCHECPAYRYASQFRDSSQY